MSTRCTYSDLRPEECDHCGAHPGNAGVNPPQGHRNGPQSDEQAATASSDTRTPFDVTAAILGYLAPDAPWGRPKLSLGQPTSETCACGQPTRDQAVACDDCADELARILGDTPWLVEQLDLAVTGQRAKRPGAERGNEGLPWNENAAVTLAEIRNELVTTIRICIEDHVPHQSVDHDWPADTCEAMSRWLLWRVDGLTRHDAWTDILRNLRRLEGDTLRIIDNPPALLFLGWCNREIAPEDPHAPTEECDGPVYAREGKTNGECRTCRKEYPVAASRAALAAALDDRLCTAGEIARLSTYLDLDVPRDRVRQLINTWHRRNRIEAAATTPDGEPMFRYGAVRVALSVTYERREKGMMGA